MYLHRIGSKKQKKPIYFINRLCYNIKKSERTHLPRCEKMSVCLYFVVPCYNDADVLPISVPVFLKKLDDLNARSMISDNSMLVLLNDGSSDETWETIVSLRENDKRIVGINMAYNVGEQNALLAGLTYAAPKSDCVITMDSDLQDDINTVDRMLEDFIAGNELVLGVRTKRAEDPFFEKVASGLFYRIMDLAKTGQIREHANYRLLSRKAIGQLLAHTETNYYLPCVVSNMGLKRSLVYHERGARAAGSSGYTVVKKIRLALDAVMIHSRLPLKLISTAAVLCAVLFLASAVASIIVCVNNRVWYTPLWLFSAVFFVGSAGLSALRILADYLFMIFGETRAVPRWQIDNILED